MGPTDTNQLLDLPELDQVPSLPASALEVLRVTESQTSDIDDLVRAVEKDPALAAKLLRLANSSMYNRGGEITSLARAGALLGMKTTKLMSLSFSLTNSYGGDSLLDMPTYWEHSLVCAAVGRATARELSYRFVDEAFLCGLLSHVGKPALATAMHDRYTELIDTTSGWPSIDQERAAFGFSEAEITKLVLEMWEIPEALRLPASTMHDASFEPDQELDRVLRFSAAVSSAMTGTSSPGHVALLGRDLGLDEAALECLLNRVADQVGESAQIFEVEIASTSDQLISRAREQLVAVSLDTALDLRVERERTIALAAENVVLETEATTDALTGLQNRRAFDSALSRSIESRIKGRPHNSLGMIIIDLDHFKAVNDTYGHVAGDDVLREVGQLLRQQTREYEEPYRYGGEEFAVILSNVDPEMLPLISERLRAAIEQLLVHTNGIVLNVSASIGAAWLSEPVSADDQQLLIEAADQQLYRAKDAGRNCTRCERS